MIEEMAFKNIDNILKPFILCILNKIYHAQPYFHLVRYFFLVIQQVFLAVFSYFW